METLEARKPLVEIHTHEPRKSHTLEAPDTSQTLEPAHPRRTAGVDGVAVAPVTTKNQAETPGAVGSSGELGLGFSSVGRAEESPFAVGELVWGKIKSHLWWPGQVYDPSHSSERSQTASRRTGRGVLVAYFGDNTFAWCEPCQLKPFFQEFPRMACQSTGKSFATAVEAALEEIANYLELQLACNCVEGENRARLGTYRVDHFPIANYTPLEFVELVQDAAKDVAVVDLLEATMLQSWVLAFSRGRGWSENPSVYHQRRKILDLVDKIDLDAPPGDAIREEGEEESYFTGCVAAKGPVTFEEKQHHRKKRRSMAALIAEMDLNTVEIDDDDEGDEEEVVEVSNKKSQKKGEDVEGLNVKNPTIEVEELSGSGKRERKKSKYLSPPYTNLGGYGKHSISSKDEDLEVPEQFMEPTHAIGSPVIYKCNFNSTQGADEKGSVYRIDSASAYEIFSEFLAAAVNPLHLKWNRLAKTVRGFFAIYRSLVYSSGSDFEAYQKHLSGPGPGCCGNGNVTDKGMTGKGSEGGQSEKNKKRKYGANEGTPTDLNHDMIGSSECSKASQRRKVIRDGAEVVTPPTKKSHSEQGTASRKRKMKKDGDNAGIHLDLGQHITKHSVTGLKRRMRKAGVDSGVPVPLAVKVVNGSTESKSRKRGRRKTNGEITVDLGNGLIDFVEGKIENSRGVTNGKGPLEVGPDFVDYLGAQKSGRKRRKSKAGDVGEAVVDLDPEITNCSEKGKSRQKRKRKNEANNGSPAALLLTFSSGFAVPSKDQIISVFCKYGALIESETEILKDSCAASIVFATSTDAEKAFNDRDRNVAFKPPAVTYRLRYLPGNLISPRLASPVTKPPLPYIRKSLERMISTLTENSSPKKEAGSSDALKPEARENLVGEMQGLLKKVNKMLSGPATGTTS